MSFLGIYETAGSAMSAQTVRLNTISSNLANADSVASNKNDVYKPLKPVFSSIYNQMEASKVSANNASIPVLIADVIEMDASTVGKFEPQNPLSNEDGYVYYSGVNVINEMADMMSATRGFEASVEVLGNVKSMQQSLLRVWEI